MEKLEIDVSAEQLLKKNNLKPKLKKKAHLKPIHLKLGKNIGSIKTVQNEDDLSDIKEVLSMLGMNTSNSPYLEKSTQCTELKPQISKIYLDTNINKKQDLLLAPICMKGKKNNNLRVY